MRSCLKPMEFALLLILALGLATGLAKARRLETTGMVSPIDGQIPSAKVDQLAHKTLHFEMLPKGDIIPPSGPSTRTSASPPPPPHRQMSQHNQLIHKTLHFEMLPKGDIIPPSGPSTKTSASPPPPHHWM